MRRVVGAAVGTGIQDVEPGAVLWEPSPERRAASRMQAFLDRVRGAGMTDATEQEELWQWSVEHPEDFWRVLVDHFDVPVRGVGEILADPTMPGARWFPGAETNYVDQALRRRGDHVAVVHRSEDGVTTELTADELVDLVARAARGLRDLGVTTGDRVGGYLPNVPEAVVAFLATASIGAIWSACPPEFGPRSVVDRFGQIEPKVLFACEQYRYRGRVIDRRPVIAEVRRALPSLEHVVGVPYGGVAPEPHDGAPTSVTWADLLAEPAALEVTSVPFDHPLWIVYSSGTTGPPKPLVHGHGGIVLEHLKWLGLHTDLGPDDRFFWFTTTGWIMWNAVVGGLLTGASIVLYDGDPAHPDVSTLWRLAADTRVTCFGGSPPFFEACRGAGLSPGEAYDLSALRGLGSTGAPLSPDGFAWLYDHVGTDLHVGSASGGTDIATAWVGPSPLLPVRAGEIQTRLLGGRVEAWGSGGESLVDEVGELVVTAPIPSMPLRLWGDEDGSRMRESYFDTYPGVWRHGDWVRITKDGACVITGRSDATLKRAGVRMGTGEFYAVVDTMPEVAESLVVDVGHGAEQRSELVLLVAMAEGQELDDAFRTRLVRHIRDQLSPRHAPDVVLGIRAIPRTLNGKKLEVPVKRILEGATVEEVASLGSVDDPAALRDVAAIARARRTEASAADQEHT